MYEGLQQFLFLKQFSSWGPFPWSLYTRLLSTRMQAQDPYAHYKIGRELGSGKFGNVCLASCLRSGKEFAIKAIAKHQPDFNIRLVRREVEILNIVSAHPNIAGLHEVSPSSYWDLA